MNMFYSYVSFYWWPITVTVSQLTTCLLFWLRSITVFSILESKAISVFFLLCLMYYRFNCWKIMFFQLSLCSNSMTCPFTAQKTSKMFHVKHFLYWLTTALIDDVSRKKKYLIRGLHLAIVTIQHDCAILNVKPIGKRHIRRPQVDHQATYSGQHIINLPYL